jgi:hypothetical protein
MVHTDCLLKWTIAFVQKKDKIEKLASPILVKAKPAMAAGLEERPWTLQELVERSTRS